MKNARRAKADSVLASEAIAATLRAKVATIAIVAISTVTVAIIANVEISVVATIADRAKADFVRAVAVSTMAERARLKAAKNANSFSKAFPWNFRGNAFFLVLFEKRKGVISRKFLNL